MKAWRSYCFLGSPEEYEIISKADRSDINASIESAFEKGLKCGYSQSVTFHMLDKLGDYSLEESEIPLFLLIFDAQVSSDNSQPLNLESILNKLGKLFHITDLNCQSRREHYEKFRERRIKWLMESSEKPSRRFVVSNVFLKKGTDAKRHFSRTVESDGLYRIFHPIKLSEHVVPKQLKELDAYVLYFVYFTPEAAKKSLENWRRQRKNKLDQPLVTCFLPEMINETEITESLAQLPTKHDAKVKAMTSNQLRQAFLDCVRVQWEKAFEDLHETIISMRTSRGAQLCGSLYLAEKSLNCFDQIFGSHQEVRLVLAEYFTHFCILDTYSVISDFDPLLCEGRTRKVKVAMARYSCLFKGSTSQTEPLGLE